MDIPVQADVLCTDGPVGKSTYVVVDLVSEQVTHVVVQMDRHGEKYVVPVELIDDADRSSIHLTCSKDDVAGMTEFRESYFNGYDNYDGSPPVPSGGAVAPTTLYHPPRVADAERGDGEVPPPVVPLAVNKGARVLATDDHVGKVDEFIIDPESHQITHLVLREHGFLHTRIITVPVSAVERAEMNTVYLNLDKATVEALPHVVLKKFPWEA